MHHGRILARYILKLYLGQGLSKVLLGPKARESWYMDWALVSLAIP